jgi:tungstate transport system substrate-binding protein
MKRLIVSFAVLLFISACATGSGKYDGTYGAGAEKLLLATGSPGELGLVKVLAEDFSKKNNITVYWKKAGTGEALDFLKNKKVDMVMVHGPEAEKKAVKEGWATQRVLIGSNEFYIVGPVSDPAKISKAKKVEDAYKKIADSKSKFYSRGDNSGTHKKELAIWKKANINPSGDWYIISKGFMAEILKKANEEQGYFMTDSSTWIAFKKDVPKLKILFKGDKFIINTYHTLRNPDSKTAAKFIDFLSSPEGQKIIKDFGKKEHGEGLYNDAAYAKKYED